MIFLIRHNSSSSTAHPDSHLGEGWNFPSSWREGWPFIPLFQGLLRAGPCLCQALSLRIVQREMPWNGKCRLEGSSRLPQGFFWDILLAGIAVGPQLRVQCSDMLHQEWSPGIPGFPGGVASARHPLPLCLLSLRFPSSQGQSLHPRPCSMPPRGNPVISHKTVGSALFFP